MTRGSDWIKCDLHIHSPSSFFHGYGDRNNPAIWERFLTELEALPDDFKVIGTNDYLTIEGYLRLRDAKAKGRLPKIECILPVVEFRLNRLAGDQHCILAGELLQNDISSARHGADRNLAESEPGFRGLVPRNRVGPAPVLEIEIEESEALWRETADF
jgi:hypothetical protein